MASRVDSSPGRRAALPQLAAALLAVAGVTGAYYAWRALQARDARLVLPVYLVSAALLLAGDLIAFRLVVRRAYRRHGRLTRAASCLQLLLAGLLLAFPSIYNPPNWAWSAPAGGQASPIRGGVAVAVLIVGVVGVGASMAWLGLRRSLGQDATNLEVAGPYRFSRNPQLVAGALVVIGIGLLWPSWYALGWVGLAAAFAHLMVLAEEEHLRRVHGEAYQRYYRRVPRYLGVLRRTE